MNEPSPHSSRLLLAGGVAAAITLGGAGFLLGRSTIELQPVAIPQTESPPPASVLPPAAPAVLARADLIKIAADASDAFAFGQGTGSTLEQMDGKRFEIRLPFGCDGSADDKSTLAMRWRYDEAAKALRLHVAPATWLPSDWKIGDPDPSVQSPKIESIEGFWIDQPWTTSESCPAPATEAAPEAEPNSDIAETEASAEHSLAIGQFFQTDGGTRADQRKGKPYSSVLRMPPHELDTSGGLKLRLTGRIVRLPTGEVVHCQQAAGPRQRPACLISAQFDEVAIENPVSSKILATWRVGHR